ncbi:hypothetical protein NA57DRAFT_73216 [Rhizodiscina lignyota]|uniref:DUF1275 domain protein n=1 Tax=Rhizodiscina lignyota TaxID=1504668 RepID=A0A9P4IM58_9PEZI|nr:hypothetical protein NA57DRAFT_73216 [Rhizodiscina lignyota]
MGHPAEGVLANDPPIALVEERKSSEMSSRQLSIQDQSKENPSSTSEASTKERLVSHLSAPIRVSFLAELELILLTFATGIQDATTFPDYHCFASNQTGNTVMLALSTTVPGLAGTLFITENIGVSLALFLAGGWITGQISHHFVNKRSRWWLLLCNFLQTVLVFGAAAIQFKFGVQREGSRALAVLALLAFASGSQVVQSRSLAMTEISTAMATAAWVDLMIDSRLFHLKNRPRNRRAFFLIALVCGSFVGAALYRSAGSAWAIFVSAAAKLIVTVLYLFNSPEKKQPSNGDVC